MPPATSKSSPLAGGEPRVDVGILTVIPAELRAARAALSGALTKRESDADGTVYWHGTIRSELQQRDVRIVLTCIGEAGNSASAAAASALLSKYEPSALILMGIAAGMRDKTRIGQVVLSERVVAYEPAALVKAIDGSHLEEPRPEIDRISHSMQQALASYDPDLQRISALFLSMKGEFPAPSSAQQDDFAKHVATSLSVQQATIASGEKLLRDPDKLLEIRRLHGKIEVVEMEAAGIVNACRRGAVPWLVIRGVSDFGDQLKDNRFHAFASMTAAAVLVDFLVHGFNGTGPSGGGRTPVLMGHEAVLALTSDRLDAQVRAVGRGGKYDPRIFVPRHATGEIQRFVRFEETFRADVNRIFGELGVIARRYLPGTPALEALRQARLILDNELHPTTLGTALRDLRQAFYYEPVAAIESGLDVAINEKSEPRVLQRLREIQPLLMQLPWINARRIDQFNGNILHAARLTIAYAGRTVGTVSARRRALLFLPALRRWSRTSRRPDVSANELLREIERLIEQHTSRCAVLIAKAGRGKTNVLCHLAKTLGEESPVVLLSGQAFSSVDHDIEARVRQQMEAPSSADLSGWPQRFSDALGASRGWLFVLIDGINESADLGAMRRALETFLSGCEGRRIKVILSCRDTFWELFSESLQPFLQRNAPVVLDDFDDDEWENALARYRESYRISFTLGPDARRAMRNPLLLRFFCETNSSGPSERHRDVGEVLDVHLADVFDKYVTRVVRSIAERSARRDASPALDLLLRAGNTMWTNRVTAVSTTDLGLSSTDLSESDSSYAQLRDEGVIFEEPTSGPWERGAIRFVYDEFMEYVVARSWAARLNNSSDAAHTAPLIQAAVEAFSSFAPAWGALLFLDHICRPRGRIVNDAIEAFAGLGEELMVSRQTALLSAFQNVSAVRLDDRLVGILVRFEEVATPAIKDALAPVILRAFESSTPSPQLHALTRKILEVDHESIAPGPSEEEEDDDAICGLPPIRHHYSHQVRLAAMSGLAGSGAADLAQVLEEGTRKLGMLDVHTALDSIRALDRAPDEVVLGILEKHIRAKLPEYRVYCAWLLRQRYGVGPAVALLRLLTDQETRVHRYTYRLFEKRKVESALLLCICERLEAGAPEHSWHVAHLVRLLGDPRRFLDAEMSHELRIRVVTQLEKMRLHKRPALRLEAYRGLLRFDADVDRAAVTRALDAETDVYLRRFAAEARSIDFDVDGRAGL